MPNVRNGLSAEKLRELARGGAEAVLRQMRAEIEAIERTFPELSVPSRRRKLVKATAQTVRRRTRTMSAAARKAISERMTRYWAERKKAKGKTK